MKPEVLEAHLVPMRPESERGFEPIVLHKALEPCLHGEPCKELQDDVQFKKLKKFEPGERVMTGLCEQEKRGNVVNTRRAWRVRTMALGEHDWDTVAVGLPRHEVPQLDRPRTVRVMPSQDVRGPQGMRNCSRKLETAEMYSSRYHVRSRSGSRGSSSEVDYEALAEVMKGL